MGLLLLLQLASKDSRANQPFATISLAAHVRIFAGVDPSYSMLGPVRLLFDWRNKHLRDRARLRKWISLCCFVPRCVGVTALFRNIEYIQCIAAALNFNVWVGGFH